jgi:hypothetical protein
MTILQNPSHECFCLLRAEGESATAAYIKSGYSMNGAGQSAHRLLKNAEIKGRILEIRTKITDQTVEKASLSEAYIINGLCEIAKTCGDPTAKTWRPQAAIRALQLLGATLGMWITRVDDRRRVDDWQSAEELDAAVRAIRGEIDDLEEQRARLLEDAASQ